MKKVIRKINKIIIGVFTLLVARSTHAADILSGESIISRPVGQGILPGGGSEGTDITSSVVFTKTIPFLITWGINLAAGLSVAVGIIGGYMYITAYGDEEKRGKGIKSLTYALIGLVVAITAYGLISIITRIQFS